MTDSWSFIWVGIIFYSLLSEPSVAPNDVSFSRLNQTTFNTSWSLLTRKESYGKVISYEVKISLVSSGSRQKRSPANSKTVSTTKAFVILYDIQPCYNVYVRAYTKAGPGPYGQPLPLELSKFHFFSHKLNVEHAKFCFKLINLDRIEAWCLVWFKITSKSKKSKAFWLSLVVA